VSAFAVLAALAVNALLPLKSRKKYDKAYQQFEDWYRKKRVSDITEEVLLAYFEQKSGTQRLDIMGPFLDAQVYNPIEEKYRNRQICKPDNVHQKKINQPVGFRRNPIFLPNRRYLLMKVKVTFL
jgi:hypothetical protein